MQHVSTHPLHFFWDIILSCFLTFIQYRWWRVQQAKSWQHMLKLELWQKRFLVPSELLLHLVDKRKSALGEAANLTFTFYCNVTLALPALYWLPVAQWIDCKLCVHKAQQALTEINFNANFYNWQNVEAQGAADRRRFPKLQKYWWMKAMKLKRFCLKQSSWWSWWASLSLRASAERTRLLLLEESEDIPPGLHWHNRDWHTWLWWTWTRCIQTQFVCRKFSTTLLQRRQSVIQLTFLKFN